MGTPPQIIAQMRPFIDEGGSSFMVDCGGFPDLTTLELLIAEVLPALNHSWDGRGFKWCSGHDQRILRMV